VIIRLPWKPGETGNRWDAARVWKWKADYTNPAILDGTLWSFVADFGDLSIATRDRNAYPEQTQFDAMLAAVQELLGGKTFQ